MHAQPNTQKKGEKKKKEEGATLYIQIVNAIDTVRFLFGWLHVCVCFFFFRSTVKYPNNIWHAPVKNSSKVRGRSVGQGEPT